MTEKLIREQDGEALRRAAGNCHIQRQQHTGRVRSTKQVETLDVCGGRSTTFSVKLSPVLSPASRRMTIMISSIQRLRVFEQRLPIFIPCATPDLATFTTVNVDDVIHAIKMSPSKQCASDSLSTWLLKECASTVAPFITRILNMSLPIALETCHCDSPSQEGLSR